MIDDSSVVSHPDIPDANATQSTEVDFLEFLKPLLMKSKVMVDVGCGTGRVIQWLLDEGYEGKLIGIEIAEDVAAYAENRFADNDKVKIICGDAFQVMPPYFDLVYCYASFTSTGATNRFARSLLARYTHRYMLIYLGENGRGLRNLDGFCCSGNMLTVGKRARAGDLLKDPECHLEELADGTLLKDADPDLIIAYKMLREVYFLVPVDVI